jgi:hypothetical protein
VPARNATARNEGRMTLLDDLQVKEAYLGV